MKNFETYLSERYENQISWYDQKSLWNQKLYKIFQWGIIILSALAPILFLIEEINKFLPVGVSVIVAILSAASKTFKFQENWIEYRTTCESLKKEKRFYDFDLYEYGQTENTENKAKLFVERCEALISQENTKWIEVSKISTEKK